MADMNVTLGARELEEVLGELEREFSIQGVPTAKRMQAAVLVEEVFAAVREAKGEEGNLRITFPRRWTIMLQYADKAGLLSGGAASSGTPSGSAAAPDLTMVQRLIRNEITNDVNAVLRDGRCIITVKRD